MLKFAVTKPKVKKVLFSASDSESALQPAPSDPQEEPLPELALVPIPPAEFEDEPTCPASEAAANIDTCLIPYSTPLTHHTRSRRTAAPLVEKVDDPEKILRNRRKRSSLQKIKDKIDQSPSLLSIIADLVTKQNKSLTVSIQPKANNDTVITVTAESPRKPRPTTADGRKIPLRYRPDRKDPSRLFEQLERPSTSTPIQPSSIKPRCPDLLTIGTPEKSDVASNPVRHLTENKHTTDNQRKSDEPFSAPCSPIEGIRRPVLPSPRPDPANFGQSFNVNLPLSDPSAYRSFNGARPKEYKRPVWHSSFAEQLPHSNPNNRFIRTEHKFYEPLSIDTQQLPIGSSSKNFSKQTCGRTTAHATDISSGVQSNLLSVTPPPSRGWPINSTQNTSFKTPARASPPTDSPRKPFDTITADEPKPVRPASATTTLDDTYRPNNTTDNNIRQPTSEGATANTTTKKEKETKKITNNQDSNPEPTKQENYFGQSFRLDTPPAGTENQSNHYTRIKGDLRRNMPTSSCGAPPVGDFSDYQKGQRALTMLLQLPNFSGSPATRFDRWIKLFENVVAMSNWTDEEKVNMLITKMTDKAHDILQNILESYTENYNEIKKVLFERFHGNETEDFYQKQFDASERKPQETILDYAFRLKTTFQRAYPSKAGDADTEDAMKLQFLRQKFLQGLEPALRNKIRYKTTETFEDLVAETQKYAIRMEADKDEKDKREFVNAVSKPANQLDSLQLQQIVQAIEKQSETVNAIATSLKFGNRAPANVQEKASDTSDNFKLLTEQFMNWLNASQHPPNHGQHNYGQLNLPQPIRPNYQNHQPSIFGSKPIRPNFNPKFRAPANNQPMGNSLPTATRDINNRPPLSEVYCTYCGKQGHTQERCWKYQREVLENGKPPICYRCREIGHIARNCPSKFNQNRPNLPGPPRNQGNA